MNKFHRMAMCKDVMYFDVQHVDCFQESVYQDPLRLFKALQRNVYILAT
jgi:hypothetical protein